MDTPTTSRGYIDDSIGLDGYGVIVDTLLENTPDLTWPLSVRTFARMRHDPQLAAILKAYTLPIRRAHWSIDGEGCDAAVTAFVADQLGLPIKGADEEPTGARRRRFTFAEHLRTSLLDLTFGHMFFEQTWVEQGGRFLLDQVQERMPQTVAKFDLNPSDGTLKSITQHGKAGQQAPVITTSDHRLVAYVNEREGANYSGQSMLRAAYGMWLIKDQMLRVHATSIRRFGMGILEVTAPPGATPQQLAEAQRYASTYRAGEFAGVGLPAGFTSTLRGLQGSVPDVVAFINYLDRQMTRATLMSILDMATAERGSRSLGETVMQLMIYAQDAVASEHAANATSQIVIPLVDANFGDDTAAPRVCVGDVGADEQLTAQDINWLLQYGGLTPDDSLEEDLRRRKGLPPIDPTTRRIAETTPAPTEPGGEQ